MRNSILPYGLALVLLFAACKPVKKEAVQVNAKSSNDLVNCLHDLSQAIIGDVFAPPNASRIYAYACVAAYEAMRSEEQYPTLAGKLNELQSFPKPALDKQYTPNIASCVAMYTVAKKLVFNAKLIAELEEKYVGQLKAQGIEAANLKHSLDYGRAVGQHILDWASKDGYLQRNANAYYMVKKTPGLWQLTPPDYTDAVEPNWGKIRPFVLKKAAQFRPIPPLAFNAHAGSPFYQEAAEVYQTWKALSAEQSAIAQFWDCNPNVSTTAGHVFYFQQKLTPGGHWLHIAAGLAEEKKLPNAATAQLLATLAVGIADAFISCWEAKYTYQYIRPVTFIQENIDPEFTPILYTPPFPEYPSGHSMVSGAASSILSHFLGQNFAFTDRTEVNFGQKPRSFQSFTAAAEEASISRLYGGIHFKSALTQGLKQGQQLGNFVLTQL